MIKSGYEIKDAVVSDSLLTKLLAHPLLADVVEKEERRVSNETALLDLTRLWEADKARLIAALAESGPALAKAKADLEAAQRRHTALCDDLEIRRDDFGRRKQELSYGPRFGRQLISNGKLEG